MPCRRACAEGPSPHQRGTTVDPPPHITNEGKGRLAQRALNNLPHSMLVSCLPSAGGRRIYTDRSPPPRSPFFAFTPGRGEALGHSLSPSPPRPPSLPIFCSPWPRPAQLNRSPSLPFYSRERTYIEGVYTGTVEVQRGVQLQRRGAHVVSWLQFSVASLQAEGEKESSVRYTIPRQS